MSSPNLDLVRSICAAWDHGDWRSAEWADPDMEFVFADGPEPGSYMGQGARAQALRGWLSAWEDLRQEPEEYRELDHERVLVLFRRSGRGKRSGVEIGQLGGSKGAGVFHIRDGQVTRLVSYYDRDRALADLGLAPEMG